MEDNAIKAILDYYEENGVDEVSENALYQLGRLQAKAAKYEALAEAARELVEYRKRNTKNFQLEKADDFINKLAALLK